MTIPSLAPSPVSYCLVTDPDPGAAGADVLVWDGRLDNRADLLLLFDDSLRDDTSDVALVGAAYDSGGVAALQSLIGDWSAVIRDRRNGVVVLASDFAGVRPLYYHISSRRVSWSASVQSLLAETHASTIDEPFMASYMLCGGHPHRTPFEDIWSVPPGHAVCVSARSAWSQRFWTQPAGDSCRYRDQRRYDEQLRALFREAVAVRLATNSPVVAELSGGLDSSSVVCMANRLIRSGSVTAPQLTTISYVHPGSLDLPFIHAVESACGIEGSHVSLSRAPLFSEASGADGIPIGSSPLQQAAAAIAQNSGARTFLTGQGGDTVLGNWIDDSGQVAQFLRSGRLRRACKQALVWSRVTRLPVVTILTRAFKVLWPSLVHPQPLAGIIGAADGGSVDTSLTAAFRTRTGVTNPCELFSMDWIDAAVERRLHVCAVTMTLELRSLRPSEPLRGLGYTHPLMHRPLVEFLMSVPADVLCGPGQPRRLMRRALGTLWPAPLRSRRSKGLLGEPYWDAFEPFVAKLLRQRSWQVVERGWVNHDSLRARLERFLQGLECNQAQLRQILIVENWLRRLYQPGGARSQGVS